MENRPGTGRLTFLGNPSPWLKQFLGTLQQSGSLDIHFEANSTTFLSTPVAKNRVGVVIIEQAPESHVLIETLRRSGRRLILIWIGKTFSKQDLAVAADQRVHSVIENPTDGDVRALDAIRRAMARAEASERSEDLLFSIKSVLLQLDEAGEAGPLLTELKTGLTKFERGALQSEFLGGAVSSTGETRLPFYKAQGFADALLTVQDLERTGSLEIQSKQGLGQVDFLQGRPVAAHCGEARSLKAIYRMFLWEEPQFSFKRRDPNETIVDDEFSLSLRDICLEGEALYRRFEKIRAQLPPAQLRLQLEPSALHAGTQLDRSQFSTLSSVVELGKVSQILDYNPLPDVVLYECLIGLKKSGVIKVQSAA